MAFNQFRRCLSTSSRLTQLVKAPVEVHGIEGRYASALYSAATKTKKLDAVDSDMKKVEALLSKDKKLLQFVRDPTLKKSFKKEVIESTMKKQGLTDLTVNTMCAMAENGRLPKLNAVLASFQVLMRAHRGEVDCTVTTAKELDSKTMEELQAALKGFLKKGQTLHMNAKVDPEILGGMVVAIGDKYVDMSTSSKIKTYTNAIKEAI
ncbi:ATP synthase subunit O, mitochondrial-like isoform X2 [Watersipora subatra]|uniref:ATP synthase subunit O, mitochondrial-like isoform X2 n=1 Tax=Watersipora subatra TaxID=2589382 RepID=UPI00355BE6FA